MSGKQVQPKACKGRRADGTACRAPAGADGYCFAHSPKLQRKREQARVNGGKNRASAARAAKLVPGVLKPILGSLTDALQQVHDGSLEARQGSSMAALAGAIVRVYEVGMLEERLAALEERIVDDPLGKAG